MAEKQRIFIVEDERRIARFLQIELEHEGFETATESNGKRAFERIIQENYDLVLLDLMLPEMDGITICRKVRELSDIPIIMLTAKDDIDDKVNGLDVGADDYMTKPFAVPELLARIRVALRNHTNRVEIEDQEEKTSSLFVKNLTLFPERSEAQIKIESKDDRKDERIRIGLSEKEYSLLEYLVKNKPNILTRDQILQKVWGNNYNGSTKVIEDCIDSLRNKIDDRFGEKYIQTVRERSYLIEIDSDEERKFKRVTIELSKQEFALLEYLVENKPDILTIDQILQKLWGNNRNASTELVEKCIDSLREKIDDNNGFGEKYIQKVENIGYRINDNASQKYIQIIKNNGYRIMDQSCPIFFKDVALFHERFELQFKDEKIELTKKEYTLLEYLVQNKRNVLSRDQILQTVWGYDYIGDTNVVDVYIRYLRSKIDDRFGEKYIHTVRGVGYVIKE